MIVHIHSEGHRNLFKRHVRSRSLRYHFAMAGMCECQYYCDAAAGHADVYAKRRYQVPLEPSGCFI